MKDINERNAKVSEITAEGVSSRRRKVVPLTMSPEGAFRMNCWSAWEVWDALTTERLPHHSVSIADLRSKLLYRVLFAFFYRLPRIDSLDDKIIREAVWHITQVADRCAPWDGGKEIRESWAAGWSRFTSSINPDEIKEWAEKYFLVQRDLFVGSPSEASVLEQAVRVHADFYLENILKRCMNVEFVLEGENPDDFAR
jgi:hypothetical protein